MKKKYAVGASSGRGVFIVEAEEIEFRDGWIVFATGGEVEHAFNAANVAQVNQLDEKGEPRMDIHVKGMPGFSNLAESRSAYEDHGVETV